MLTQSQNTALAAAIAADQVLADHAANKEYQQIADAMNAASSPISTLWITAMPSSVILGCILAADMPTTAALLSYLQMMLAVTSVDASNSNVRTNFGLIFNTKQTLTNLTTAAQRVATRFEALFLTSVPPANTTTAYGVTLTSQDVRNSLGA